MKKHLITGGIISVILCAPAAMAQTPAAQPQPEQAQPAPAAAPPQQNPDWMSYKNPYAGEENDIANPHRTPEEIASLAQQTATDVLTFGLANYKDKLAGFKKYFVAQGWQLYAAYLKDSGLLSRITEDGYSVAAIVSSPPEIVNSGTTDGAYHWIVKLPITLGFFTTDAEGNTKTGPSGKYILFMDLGRAADGGGEGGIVINNWRVDPAAAQ
ncbi:MAG: DotI/IcmL family type IV secretion protein [Alphaproteobacteria bacterium]|nr:DotI/IcmL family type IV secretion protein [Alphaproteobacteria bacterium]